MWQDICYSLRVLRRSLWFAGIAIFVLGLGVGASIAVFTAANALLVNPYRFPNPEQIVSVEAIHSNGKNHNTGYRDFLDWREQNSVFDEMAILPEVMAYTLGDPVEPQRIIGGLTTSGLLRVLGVRPLLGRFWTSDEEKWPAPNLAVLSYTAWQKKFDGSVSVLGHQIILNGESYTIIGVLPKDFAFPGIETCDLLAFVQENPAQNRNQHQYGVLARLKPGITVEQAQANMTNIARRLELEYPRTNTAWRVKVVPIRKAFTDQFKNLTILLVSSVALVLLLACCNLAGLQLVRAPVRSKEVAVRAALGASRARIIRQMMTENLLLASGAAAWGLLVAHWLMIVIRVAAPANSALDSTLHMHGVVLAFALVVSGATVTGFGLIPALQVSKSDLSGAIKGDACRWTFFQGRNSWMDCLVIGEVALSLLLLVVAGVLVEDFLSLLHSKLGLRTDHVLTFQVETPYSRCACRSQASSFYQNIVDRLRAAPTVKTVAAVDTLPMDETGYGAAFGIEGEPKVADLANTLVQYNAVTPGFFHAMGVPIIRGRDFDDEDRSTSPPVAIVNDTLARQFFPLHDPIGHRFKDVYGGKVRTIIGIVGSYKNRRPMNPPRPMVFRPLAQTYYGSEWVVVRTADDPAKFAAIAREVVRGLESACLGPQRPDHGGGGRGFTIAAEAFGIVARRVCLLRIQFGLIGHLRHDCIFSDATNA